MNVREEQVRQMTAIQEQLEQEKTYLSALRREFHRHPELSLQEFCTAARIEEELDRFGIPHTRVGETGVLGTLRGTGTGAGVVVLRADIDALPIQERSGAEYCSQTPGVMHACGGASGRVRRGGPVCLSARRGDRPGGKALCGGWGSGWG